MAAGPYQRTNGWQIKWREGGRGSEWQTEILAEKLDAEEFKVMVERAGNHWPADHHGQRWIRGLGFPEWVEEEDPGTPFLTYATKRIRTLVQAGRLSPGESKRYTTYARIIAGSMAVAPILYEQILADTDLSLQVAIDPILARPLLDQLVGQMSDEEIAERAAQVVVEDLDAEAIRAFITWQRVRAKHQDGTGPGRAWKTIKNYHGFLHGVLEQAYYEDLIPKNPCKMTAKEIGTGVVVKKISLTPEEFWLIHSCIDHRFQDFIEAAVGTGCRFGEITASRVKDWRPGERRLRIEEAWKRGLQGFYRGAPKSDAGERDVYVGHRVAEILSAAAEGKGDDDLLFTAVRGGFLRQNSFYEERWQPAVRKAVERGLMRDGEPIYPRFHDLRHTHIYWLRKGGLGNELIKGMVGHSDEDMTAKYGEIPAEVKLQASHAIDTSLKRSLRLV